MTTYLIRSILCLVVLLLVYLLFLEKEKMHRFNRWYLLGSIVFACIVPLISFKIQSESLPILSDNYFDIIPLNSAGVSTTQAAAQKAIAAPVDYTIPALLSIYGLVTFILLVRFGRNIYLLLSSAAKNKVIMYQGARLVLLKEKIASHSFLNNIFISEEDYSDHAIEEELITHELTHVREKHSLDVIFIELLQTIFWFNPLFIFYKKAIQLNHEYLADDAVIKTYENVPAYQYLLLDKASCKNKTYLTSNFNFSVTKKRLVMMTRKNDRQIIFIKKICMIPLLTAVIYTFSTREIIAQEKKEPIKTVAPGNQKKETSVGPVLIPGILPVTSQTGVPGEMLKEFNDIVDRTVIVTSPAQQNRGKVSFKGSEKDREKLVSIYKQMNNEQRNAVKILVVKKGPMPQKITPTDEQFEKWKNSSNYGVWIDGKKVLNEELNKYKASDFSGYNASNLNYTQKMKEDVMRRFNLKTMYKVQLTLTTNDDYNKRAVKHAAEPEFVFVYINRHDNKYTWLQQIN
ncbi:MAG: M56 family metallopeptidase [Bacteroidota bacterium]